MLTITFRNIFDLAEISDYKWIAYANSNCIDFGVLKGHKRSDGWQALVKRFVDTLKEESQPTPS